MGVTKRIIWRDQEVMGGELVFAGTRVEVKTLVDYLKAGHSLVDFLIGFQTVGREQELPDIRWHDLRHSCFTLLLSRYRPQQPRE